MAMRPDATSDARAHACPLVIADHFLERLRERLPHVSITEGALQRVLATAEWYPASGDRAYYALCRLGGRSVAIVVSLRERVARLDTVYEPNRSWWRRLGAARPWPMNLVLAAGA